MLPRAIGFFMSSVYQVRVDTALQSKAQGEHHWHHPCCLPWQPHLHSSPWLQSVTEELTFYNSPVNAPNIVPKLWVSPAKGYRLWYANSPPPHRVGEPKWIWDLLGIYGLSKSWFMRALTVSLVHTWAKVVVSNELVCHWDNSYPWV